MLKSDLIIDMRVQELADYAVRTGLLEEADRVWAVNRLLRAVERDTLLPRNIYDRNRSLPDILGDLTGYAVETGVIEEDPGSQERFAAELMGLLLPRPSQVQARFQEALRRSPREATDWFYRFSQDANLLPRAQLSQDVTWQTETPWGSLRLCFRHEPVSTPSSPAPAPRTVIPECPLCRENEGYMGRPGLEAGANLRLIPLTLAREPWYLRYSAHPCCEEHCLLLSGEHLPAQLNRAAFLRQLDFVEQFPHYFAGADADLPGVRTAPAYHDLLQGGLRDLPLAHAPVEISYAFPGFQDVSCGLLHWPVPTLRLEGSDPQRLSDLANRVLTAWRGYSDPDFQILAQSRGVPHNTAASVARMADGGFQLDLILRNNRTLPSAPHGIFAPRPELSHFHKGPLGLFAVSGVAALPMRLMEELRQLAGVMLLGGNLPLTRHTAWARELLSRRTVTSENIQDVLCQEVGSAFAQALEQIAVFPCTPQGREGFLRFLSTVGTPLLTRS